ncbi:hypothetical protein D5S17_23820 [Pseudonocardiaceae bacterium YIM PH 21723]|nr:hypothetical protein D5S17_23820 [Pseudonocardiaceae bacterium YIM PH 21723]
MRDFLHGARLLPQGFAILRRSTRLLVLGAIPAFVTSLLYVGGLAALAYYLTDIVSWMTPFADGWGAGPKTALRVLAGLLVFLVGAVVGVITFTAVTLLIGGPFYEYIAEKVEDQLGGVQHPPTGWWTLLVRGLRDSLLLVVVSVACAIPLLLAGFIPVIGQTVVPVLGACVGGWLLTLELVGVAFGRRGLRLGDRHRALRTRRAKALGLGVPTYLLCAIPFVAVIVMPAAVAGGTLLARELLTTE